MKRARNGDRIPRPCLRPVPVATQPASLAKTTRPSLAGIIPRDRLFGRLDEALRAAVVWISGPPGCGKTTLAASYLEERGTPSLWYQLDEGDADVASFFYYLGAASAGATKRKATPLPQLTPEYHAGLPSFTRRYFQALYQRLGASFCIVFDGYHEIPVQSLFHEVMRIALGEVPPGCSVMLISRGDPPPAMTRLRANRSLEVLGWQDLRLTQAETDALVARRGRKMPREGRVELHEKTQGWAAGLILMLEQAPAHDAFAAPSDLSSPGLVFEYLAGEMFQKIDAATRELLLATAYLPQMTAAMAQRLTGGGNAQTALAELHRNNHFVALRQAHPEPVYQCHPLLREFLLARANEVLGPEQRAHLRQLSAELLAAAGQPAEAVALLRESGDWTGVVAIIESLAPDMLARGMGETLAVWVDALPKEIQQQHPWTLYWLAASRVSVSPRESRLLYERSHDLFRASGDLKGALLACSGAMDAILYEVDDFSLLDRWIEVSDRMLREHPDLLSGALEARVASSLVASMIVRQPHHAGIERWTERACTLAQEQPDPNLRLAVGQRVALGIMWAGHYPKAWAIIQGMHSVAREVDVSPFMLGMLNLTEATYFMLTAEAESSLKAAREGLEIERAAGVHVLTRQLLAYGAGGALASGDTGSAEKLLEQAAALAGPRGRFDACLHHLFATWLALLKGDGVSAAQQQRLAVTAAIELGSPHFEALCRMAAAHVLFEGGDVRGALAHFQQVYDIARRIRNHLLEFTGFMMYAYVALESGRRPRSGLRALKLALEMGKPRNYLSFLLWRPEMLARLCSHALENGIEPEFVSAIVRQRHLMLDASRDALAGWPWPYRVRSFGSFRLLKNGAALTFTGKAQRRPLELLKVVVACGGRDVSATRVTEAIWPRIDGDSAHRSFTTTLHRLRKLLGEDRAILLSEGKLTLDGRYVWTDCWAFEQMTARLDQLLRGPRERVEPDKLAALGDRLLEVYTGPFLGDEPEEAWGIATRERLRARFVRSMGEISRYWQNAGQPERAADLLERALEADGLAESLYRYLMLCHAQAHHRADAIETYHRCRKAFAAILKVEPSAETTAIYQKLIASV
jgi:LuxR family maltose regulon positive regulatory protein